MTASRKAHDTVRSADSSHSARPHVDHAILAVVVWTIHSRNCIEIKTCTHKAGWRLIRSPPALAHTRGVILKGQHLHLRHHTINNPKACRLLRHRSSWCSHLIVLNLLLVQSPLNLKPHTPHIEDELLIHVEVHRLPRDLDLLVEVICLPRDLDIRQHPLHRNRLSAVLVCRSRSSPQRPGQ